MSALCFYFQVHQPYRLRHYTFFDIGVDSFYEDEDANCGIMLKVARKCYLPMNALLLKLINFPLPHRQTLWRGKEAEAGGLSSKP